MQAEPRPIAKITVDLEIPNSDNIDEKTKTILERTGNNCPITKSLHPDLEVLITYNWI